MYSLDDRFVYWNELQDETYTQLSIIHYTSEKYGENGTKYMNFHALISLKTPFILELEPYKWVHTYIILCFIRV